MYLNCVILLAIFTGGLADSLPSFITPCHRNDPPDTLNACIVSQARQILPHLKNGLPEYGMDPIDPLSISDLTVSTGNLNIKEKNYKLRGLSSMDIKELKWDLQKNTGFLRIFGNLTMICDYETNGRLLVIPVSGTGKLTVKMQNTEIIMRYKFKRTQGADGKEHLATYDLKAKQTYERVRYIMTSDLGENVLTSTINQVMNENWKELISEVGPPHTKAISAKVSKIINALYSRVPFDELLPNS